MLRQWSMRSVIIVIVDGAVTVTVIAAVAVAVVILVVVITAAAVSVFVSMVVSMMTMSMVRFHGSVKNVSQRTRPGPLAEIPWSQCVHSALGSRVTVGPPRALYTS